MFTGIVQAIGQIESALPQSTVYRSQSERDQAPWSDQQGLRLLVAWGDLDHSDVQEGDSIALNGACMTVLRPDEHGFAVDISRESLDRTTGLSEPGAVNLEKALRASDRLGGHLVSGHVDTTARIVGLDRIDESVHLQIALPAELSAFVTEKGSIAVHGVSLTINRLVDGAGPQGETVVSINLIPHTWQSTTLSQKKAGDLVNLEVDPMARQVARILERLHGQGDRRA
ncbi:MAG: riboflavin synthase [Burkholderiaceae bacterium]|jgi:riboflavin synthase|nr:riboflavin synthase [Betaproteobacteria bacterium]